MGLARAGALYCWMIHTVREPAAMAGQKASNFTFGPSAIGLTNGVNDL
jgi:hypothetical protein